MSGEDTFMSGVVSIVILLVLIFRLSFIYLQDEQSGTRRTCLVPITNSALRSSKLIKNAKLKIYKGAPHGLCTTHKEQVNADLLAFIKGGKISEAGS